MEQEYAAYEGLYSKLYRIPRFDHDAYETTILQIIKKEELDVAYVMSELEAVKWSTFKPPILSMLYPVSFAQVAISKRRVYECLTGTSLVPKFEIYGRSGLDALDQSLKTIPFPIWVRDYSDGTTSGAGSFLAKNIQEVKAWLTINESSHEFMFTEYLPGRNLACFLLYDRGRLLKSAVAERLTYLMSKVAISGVTGNASKGRFLNEDRIFEVAESAVQLIAERTHSKPHGVLVVDLKEDANGVPRVTEINLRHVAITSSLAQAGANFAEWQLLCTLGRINEITGDVRSQLPEKAIFLRDVDGVPILVADYMETQMGCYV